MGMVHRSVDRNAIPTRDTFIIFIAQLIDRRYDPSSIYLRD